MRKSLILLAILFLLFVFIGNGCQHVSPAAPQEGKPGMSIQISSSVFTEEYTIPTLYTCDGQDISPPLVWSGIPPETKSLALITDDPDAPAGTWVHWVLFNIPANQYELPERAAPGLGIQGKNDFRKLGYGGPCPPMGKPHRYYFKLYALDTILNLPTGSTKAEVEKAMQGHILGQGQLIGKYGR
jgi:Raf kinase inhibitor-like YbhB/YbcL family protein